MDGRRTGIALTYGAAFLQGLALVSFPASGAVLKGAFGLDDAQYGAIFLPQVALAVVGAFGGGTLARRLGLKPLFLVSLAALALSQIALAAGLWLPEAARFAAVATGTALLGFGFGLGGAPLNSYALQFFPARSDTALVALHSLVGLGLSAGPLAVSALGDAGWVAFPLALGAACALTAFAGAFAPLPASEPVVETASGEPPAASPAFWAFATIAVLYAFAEGTFSNWAVVYLHEVKGLGAATAGLALSLFWAALVAGRLAVSALVLAVPAVRVWIALPVLMIAAFLLLPAAGGAASALALFAFAGLACSAFFPLTIGLATRRYTGQVAWVSSMMIAALMIGVGLGSFVVGALRSALPLESLYRVSAAYPAAALAIAIVLVANASARRRLAVP